MKTKSIDPIESTLSATPCGQEASRAVDDKRALSDELIERVNVIDSLPPYGISAEAWAARHCSGSVTTAEPIVVNDTRHNDDEMTVALAVPDPRVTNVPVGWWDSSARTVIEQAVTWDQLDEIEAQLLGMASYIEALDRDSLEFAKALRVVECRRGQLLGNAEHGGDRRSEEFQLTRKLLEDHDVSSMTASRYRLIAGHWDVLYQHLLTQTDHRKVTQSHLLRLITERSNGLERLDEVLVNDLTRELNAYIGRLRQRWPIAHRTSLGRQLRRLADAIDEQRQ